MAIIRNTLFHSYGTNLRKGKKTEENQNHDFYIRWLLISLCATKVGLYEIPDEKIGNLEEGDLSIEDASHSQHIITLIQNYTM